MRRLIFAVMVLIAAPAVATDWGSYENGRFGYAVDIPSGFSGQGEAENGDGQVFVPASGLEKLTVWGGNIVEEDFAAHVAHAMALAADDGWALSYQASSPSWASFSGKRNGQILYARIISLCSGSQYATFWLEYPVREIGKLDPIVSHLVGSLEATGKGVSC